MTTTPWRNWGDAIVARYARSWWRLPLLLVVATLVIALPLWGLRGPRLLQLVAVGGVGAVGGAICFAHPFQTLVAALFIGYAGLGQFLPGPLGALLTVIAAARVLFDAASGQRLWFGSRMHRIALAVLLATAVTSLLAVQDWVVAGRQLHLIGFGLATAFAIVQLADRPGRVLTLCIAMAAGMATATLWVLRGLVASSGTGLLELAVGVRLAGLGSDPNAQATYAVALMAPIVMAVGRVQRRSARAALVALAFLLLAATVLTQSRAGILILGALLVWLVLRVRRGRTYAVVALAAAAVVALLLPQSYWVRFASIAQFSGIVVDYSLQLRQHAMEGAWQTFLDHPWIGVGLGNLPHHAPNFMLGSYLAHNTLLEVAASLGALGLVAWVAWYASAIGMARRAARVWRHGGRRGDALVAESIATALVVLGAGLLFLSMPFFAFIWTLVGLAAALDRAAASDAPSA